MRILIVSSYLPYPLFSGGAVRLFNIIKELSKKHKITLVCEIRPNQTQEDVQKIKKFCEDIIVIPRKRQWSIENIIKTGFSYAPFLVVGHTLSDMKKNIVRLLSEKRFDLIHVETSYIIQNVPKTYIPTVLVEHNIEYKVYERYMKSSPWYLRPLLAVDIWKLRKWERNCWLKATKLVAVSDIEKSLMQRSDVMVVPNGVDLKKFKIKPPAVTKASVGKKEKRILFIGDFKWIQNRKAAEWILREIWPQIESRIKNQESRIRLWIVGRKIPEYLKKIGSKAVIFDENAPDQTEKIYARAYALLAPITVGGGTSYKILESMASGTPVVTTRLGIEGLAALDKEALTGETACDLAEQTVSLLTDQELYKKISLAARMYVEKNFSWENIVTKLEYVYKSVL